MTVNDKIDEILDKVKQSPWKNFVLDNHKTWIDQCTTYPKLNGLWIEFGVYRGKTLQQIATKTSNTVYGFDSFEGLHEHWDSQNPKGVYSLGGNVPDGAINLNDAWSNPGMYDPSPTRSTIPWARNIKLVKGYFENSLPPFLETHKELASFLHIDSDLYSSAKTILTLMKDRIISGTILVFDDFSGYPDFKDRNHEVKAFAEFLLDTNKQYNSLAVHTGPEYSQCCFEIL